VTSQAARFTVPVIERLALAARAGAVICGDTTPETKPHPAPLLAGAEALAILPEQCVYVGDAERDIIAGRAAHMHTLFAAYGYVGADETPAAWNADGELDSLPELLDWLPLPADIAAPLNERFQRACRRFYDAKPRMAKA
jgi:phosphoglycolate phosphatase